MNLEKKVQTRKVLQVLLSFVGTMAAAAFSPLFLFFQNAGEAHFSDVAPTMLMFMAAGIVIYAIVFIITRNPSKAGIISIAFLVAFLNYAHIESAIQLILPSLRYWHILPIILVLLLHLAWFIWKKLPMEFAEVISPVITAIFCALIILNGSLSVPAMTTRIRAEQEAKQLAKETVVSENTMPNFYFILFDEFSTVPFMQKYFNYDNSKLVDKLENLGFNVSNTGHNEAAETAVVTANLFNLDYLVTSQNTQEEKFAARSNNKVFKMLRDAGYDIEGASRGWFYGINDTRENDTQSASTVSGETLQTLLTKATLFYPMVQQYYPELPRMIIDDLNYMKKPSNFKKSNQFVLFHTECPHPPFYFDADGNISKNITSNWNDLNSYLNQYIFASNEMVEIANSIINNDPNAIVWILSDHGARASEDARFGYFSNEDMCNFFNAVYYKGEPLDVTGLSAINTFRLILNRLLDTNFEMIQMP